MASYATSSRRAVLWTTFLTRVTLNLWRRLVVGKLHAVMSNFVLKLRWVLEPFWSYRCLKSGLNKEDENWYFHYRTLLLLAVSRVAFGHLYESCWSWRHSKRKTRRLNKLSAYLWWTYTAFAQVLHILRVGAIPTYRVYRLSDKYCIYCVSVPSLHRVYRLTDNTSECNSKQEASLAVFETM